MENKLCLRCKDRIVELFESLTPVGEQWVEEVFHCHHGEPKEKEKCWCEQPAPEKRLQLHDYIINRYGLGHYQMKGAEVANFCPNCGKDLRKEGI